VFSSGYGYFGQLGHGSYSSVTQPTEVNHLSAYDIVAVKCGESHSLALTSKVIPFQV
jgi:alpha-tubulin suppressor-like RCC1 family protein